MENEILLASAAFASALERGDATSAGELYADDARLLASPSEPLTGRDDIESYWDAGIRLGLSSVTFETRVLEWIGGGALELGRYTVSLTGSSPRPAVERGWHLVLHTQTDDGSWQRTVEVFDPDEPFSVRRDPYKEER